MAFHFYGINVINNNNTLQYKIDCFWQKLHYNNIVLQCINIVIIINNIQ